MSKGSRQRGGDTAKFSVNYDSIFGDDTNESDRHLHKKKKEGRGRSTTVTAEQTAATV